MTPQQERWIIWASVASGFLLVIIGLWALGR